MEASCVALLARKAADADAGMRAACWWALSNLAYKASPAARAALLAQLPAAALDAALQDSSPRVQVPTVLPTVHDPTWIMASSCQLPWPDHSCGVTL